jgi:hypothetical protein
MFTVTPNSLDTLGNFLMTSPSAEMSKGYIDTLLSFQIFLITRAMFSYFVILSSSNFGKVMGQGKCYIYNKCCFILSVDEHFIRSVEITFLSVMVDLSHYNICLADSNTGSGLYLQYGGVISIK